MATFIGLIMNSKCQQTLVIIQINLILLLFVFKALLSIILGQSIFNHSKFIDSNLVCL